MIKLPRNTFIHVEGLVFIRSTRPLMKGSFVCDRREGVLGQYLYGDDKIACVRYAAINVDVFVLEYDVPIEILYNLEFVYSLN